MFDSEYYNDKSKIKDINLNEEKITQIDDLDSNSQNFKSGKIYSRTDITKDITTNNNSLDVKPYVLNKAPP